MEQIAANIKDFISLQESNSLGELVAFEIERNVFQLCGINVASGLFFVMHDTTLTEVRKWNGTRCLWDIAEKIGVRELKIKSNLPLPVCEEPPAKKEVRLSNGLVVAAGAKS